MLIRREAAGDAAAIGRVHARAFGAANDTGEPAEVRLVEELRRSKEWLPRLSLVAIVAEDVVGHVVCSRSVLGVRRDPVLGLAPIGVHPDYQAQGIGSALVHAVLGAADACDEPLVGLLGEPAYYRRFGFLPAAELGIQAPDPAWGDYFQVRRLSSYTPELRGRFRYPPSFGEL